MVRDAPMAAALERIFALGADVLTVAFEALAGEPGSSAHVVSQRVASDARKHSSRSAPLQQSPCSGYDSCPQALGTTSVTFDAEIDFSGGRGSNTGDVFHELWAARECLRLLDSESNLEAVKVEGTRSSVQNLVWESADCTLYFGGDSSTRQPARRVPGLSHEFQPERMVNQPHRHSGGWRTPSLS